MFARVFPGTLRLTLVTLAAVATVVGATPAPAADSLQDLSGMIERYAEDHLTRGEILLGVDLNGDTQWYSSGELEPGTSFEIGSVTKTFTGMLLAAEIASGRVTPRTTVGELWPTGPRAAEREIPAISEALADVTLEQLATHTSGLPRLNLSPVRLLRTILHQDDPYAGLSAADVFRDAASASIGEPGTFQYSNLGYALLGVLLVEGHDRSTSYPQAYLDAVRTRVLAPLALPPTVVAGESDDLPRAFLANGRGAERWRFDGYFAAGGIVASGADVLQYVRSVHDLPGELTAAVVPYARAGDRRHIGYGWLMEELDNGDRVVWHNGGTGGFSTFVAAVPARGLTVTVFGTSAVSVDSLGRAIVLGRGRVESPIQTTPVRWVIGAGLLLWLGWFVVSRLVRTRPTDLITAAQGVVEAIFVVSVWARSAPPALYIPGIQWVLVAAALGVGIVQSSRTLRAGETTRLTGGRSRPRIFAAAAQIAIFGGLALVLW